MQSTARAPADLLQLAVRAAHAAFCAALDIGERQSTSRLDAQLVEKLRCVIVDAVDADLRRHSHLLNKKLCTATRVPPELWVLTWDELSIRDRVTVSHVCQDWRRLAVGTPQLWTRINFRCECYASYGDEVCQLDHDSQLDDKAWGGSAWTTTNGLDVFLNRGRSRNLDLRIQLFNSHCVERISEDIIDLLSSHARRIAHLEFKAETGAIRLIDFLDRLGGVFPHMRTLVGSEGFDHDDDSESSDDELDDNAVIVPRLESLQLSDVEPLWSRHIITSLACHHLLQISMQPTRSADLYGLLSNFPALQVVHLDMRNFIVGSTVRLGDAKFKSLAVQAQKIRFSNFIRPEWDSMAIEMSEILGWALQPTRQSVAIEYGYTMGHTVEVEQEVLSLFLQSLPTSFPDTSTDISAIINYGAKVDFSVTAGNRAREITLTSSTQFDLTRVYNTRITELKLCLTIEGMGRSDLSQLVIRSALVAPVQVLFPALKHFMLSKYIATDRPDNTRDIRWSTILPPDCNIQVKINILEAPGRKPHMKEVRFSKTMAFAIWYWTDALSAM